MNGPIAIARLLFTALPLQRWLIGAGAAVALAGYPLSDSTAEAIAFLLIGMAVPFMPTLFIAFIMASFAATKSARLIPHARRQLVTGLATFVAISTTVVVLAVISAGFRPANFALPWMQVALGLSLWILLPFGLPTGNKRRWLVWWLFLVIMILVPRASEFHLGKLLVQPWAVLAALAALWIAFAVLYLRRRGVTGAAIPHVHERDVSLYQSTPAAAVRALLFEHPSLRAPLLNGAWMTALFPIVLALFEIFGKHKTLHDSLLNALSMSLLLGLAAGTGGWPASQRSRRLWLLVGLERSELFRLCEREAWKFFAAMTPVLFLSVALGWLLSPGDGPNITKILICQLSGGAALLYLCLMHVRGWQPADVIGVLLAASAWLLSLVGMPIFSQLVPWMPDALLLLWPLILGLRVLAARRWERIDWLECRPPGPQLRPQS